MKDKKEKYGLISIIALILMLLVQCNSARILKRELVLEKEKVEREINNRLASEDSLRTILLENGSLATTIRSYEFDIQNLKENETKLLKEYESLTGKYRKLKGVNSLLRADLELTEQLLAEASINQLNDTTLTLDFTKYDVFGEGNTRYVSGKSAIFINNGIFTTSGTDLELKQNIRLRAVIDDIEGEGPGLIVSTDYPGITISDIENINLVNSKLRAKEIDDLLPNEGTLGFALGLGYGFNYAGKNTFNLGPTLNLGLYWTPKKLRLK
jgi:hypothetical protein